MPKYRFLQLAIFGVALALSGAPASAVPFTTGTAASANAVERNLEKVARRCGYDRHGRLRCRTARHRADRPYYERPYYANPYYGYYPGYFGYGFGHHHHGFHGHHGGHHHGHH